MEPAVTESNGDVSTRMPALRVDRKHSMRFRVLLLAMFCAACAHPTTVKAPAPEPAGAYIPLGVPGSVRICIQVSPVGHWVCPSVGALRAFFSTVGEL